MDTFRPQKKDFLDSIKTGVILPIYAEISLPGLTPVAALENLRSAGYPVIFENVQDCKEVGKYSFVSVDPYLIFKSYGDEVEISLPSTPSGKYGRRATMKRKPLEKLKELLSNYKTGRIAGLPPFTGGAVGFFSYDFARQLKAASRCTKADIKTPKACFVFVDMVLAFDHSRNKAWVIVNPGAREQELGFRRPDFEQGARYYDEAVLRIADAVKKLAETAGTEKPAVFSTSDDNGAGAVSPLIPDLSKSEFEGMVRRCKDRLIAEDICETVVSLRFSGTADSRDALHLHTILRNADTVSSIACLDFKDMLAASLSHECLVRCHDGIVDAKLQAQGRNCIDLVHAVIPGSVGTSASKVRCMEILDELEPVARGLFAGAVGYFSHTGDMEFNIAASTITIKEGWEQIQVGVLVTRDSDPIEKYSEIIRKAEVFRKVLQKQ